MKKTYISPLLTQVSVQVENNMMALSMLSSEAQQDGEVLVKGERRDVQDYDVWDDDWSK